MLWSAAAGGADLTAEPATLPPPDELSAAVRSLLLDEAVVVQRDGARIEFWWIAAPPGDAAGALEWTDVPAGALLGALRTAEPLPDIRGVAIPAGVYTLRFARQPQDGDHLGVSPYREFLVVARAADDGSAEPIGYRGAVALGRKTQGRSHPAVLSIDPPRSGEAPGTVVRTEEGHGAVVFAAGSAERTSAPLRFGVILSGVIEH